MHITLHRIDLWENFTFFLFFNAILALVAYSDGVAFEIFQRLHFGVSTLCVTVLPVWLYQEWKSAFYTFLIFSLIPFNSIMSLSVSGHLAKLMPYRVWAIWTCYAGCRQHSNVPSEISRTHLIYAFIVYYSFASAGRLYTYQLYTYNSNETTEIRWISDGSFILPSFRGSRPKSTLDLSLSFALPLSLSLSCVYIADISVFYLPKTWRSVYCAL